MLQLSMSYSALQTGYSQLGINGTATPALVYTERNGNVDLLWFRGVSFIVHISDDVTTATFITWLVSQLGGGYPAVQVDDITL